MSDTDPMSDDAETDLHYKCACEFVENEGLAHVYDSMEGIGSGSFNKLQLLSIYLSQLVREYRIPREGYRKLVRFINTCIRDHDEIVSGKIYY